MSRPESGITERLRPRKSGATTLNSSLWRAVIWCLQLGYYQHSGNPCNTTTRGSFSSSASTQWRIRPFTRPYLWIHGYLLHAVIVPNDASFIQHSSTVFIKRNAIRSVEQNERELGKEKLGKNKISNLHQRLFGKGLLGGQTSLRHFFSCIISGPTQFFAFLQARGDDRTDDS